MESRQTTVQARLTVLFEDPFWVGLYERASDGKYEVCKITFGAEPKDYEVHRFFLENWHRLCFSPHMDGSVMDEQRQNPKRMQREIQKAVQNTGMGTKAQQALQLQREQDKLARKERSKQQRSAEEQRRFDLRREKRKEKRRGH